MRVTSKGQVTIPIEIRRELGIDESTEVEFEIVENTIRIKVAATSPRRGERILRNLLAQTYNGPSTDELMALTRDSE